jgi:S-adenosylhomocysteine hydrolase
MSTTVFYKDYPYPNRDTVAQQLREWGLDVRPVTSIDSAFFTELRAKTIKTSMRILVIEDGGYLTPGLIRDPELASRVIGTVEQTTRGLWNIEAAMEASMRPPQFPILSLPHSTLKQKFEPPHIGDGAVTAIQNLLHGHCLRNMRAAVLGCGSIGNALVNALSERGSVVSLYDPDPQARLLGLNLCGKVAESAVDAVCGADLVFGACGRTSITPSVIRAAKHGVWLISVSSERIEIATHHLERTASRVEPIRLHQAFVSDTTNSTIGTRYYLRPTDKVVNLLANGMPVNFMGFGGMPDQAADLVMSIVFIAARELAAGRYTDRKGVLKKAIDRLVKTHSICEQYLQFWV